MKVARQLVIDPSGGVRCVYDETLPLSEFGQLTIARGLHVVPTDSGHWTADLSPVGGPFSVPSRSLLGPFSVPSSLGQPHWWRNATGSKGIGFATAETQIEHGQHAGQMTASLIRVSSVLFRGQRCLFVKEFTT